MRRWHPHRSHRTSPQPPPPPNEPELFPALVYRMEVPKVVVLVFVSGRFVLTGAKSRSVIVEAATRLYPLLYKFAKKTGAK